VKKNSFFLLLAVIAITSCNKDNPPNIQPPSITDTTLTSKVWVLKFILQKGIDVPAYFPKDEPKKISIKFNRETDTFSFNGICNSGEGNYQFLSIPGHLSISNLLVTKTPCLNYEWDWDRYTAESLRSAYYYIMSGINELTIYTNGNLTMIFSGQ